MLILALVGRKGSGKGTVAGILAERHRAAVYRFSTPLRDILKRLGLEQSRENLIRLSEVLRQGFGEHILEQALTKDVRTETAPIVVLDGIRRPEELTAFMSMENFHLISIEAPFDIRYERSANRGENAGEVSMSREDFERTERASTEVTIAAVEQRAEQRIKNTGTYEDLVRQVDRIVESLC